MFHCGDLGWILKSFLILFCFVLCHLQGPEVMGGRIGNPAGVRMMLVEKASSSTPMALALTRSGTLAELVSWGESNCAHASSDVVRWEERDAGALIQFIAILHRCHSLMW